MQRRSYAPPVRTKMRFTKYLVAGPQTRRITNLIEFNYVAPYIKHADRHATDKCSFCALYVSYFQILNRCKFMLLFAASKILLNSSDKVGEKSGDNEGRMSSTDNIDVFLSQTPRTGGRCVAFWEQYGGHQWGARNMDTTGNTQHFRLIQTSKRHRQFVGTDM